MNDFSKKIKKLTVVVIGCGSIGERHIYNLKNFGVNSLHIVDFDKNKVKKLEAKYNVKGHFSTDKSLSVNPDLSIICTDPASHITLAEKCLKKSSHIFIEKPISHDPNKVKLLLKNADSKKLKIFVGYNFRYNSGLNELKNILKKQNKSPYLISSNFGHHIKYWHPNSNFKNHYILKKNNGIILDDSHEYDLIKWLLEDKVESVYCQSIKTPKLSKYSESLASIVLKFKKGTIANLTLDFLRPSYQRNCKILFEDKEFNWDFNIKKKNKNYQNIANITITSQKLDTQRKIQKISEKVNEMYQKEMYDFISSIIKDTKPTIDGWDALETLKIGNAALESAKKGKVQYIRY